MWQPKLPRGFTSSRSMRTEQVSNNFRAFHAKETTEITINRWDSKQGTKEGMILKQFFFLSFLCNLAV